MFEAICVILERKDDEYIKEMYDNLNEYLDKLTALLTRRHSAIFGLILENGLGVVIVYKLDGDILRVDYTIPKPDGIKQYIPSLSFTIDTIN